jgi:hypothetical protein
LWLWCLWFYDYYGYYGNYALYGQYGYYGNYGLNGDCDYFGNWVIMVTNVNMRILWNSWKFVLVGGWVEKQFRGEGRGVIPISRIALQQSKMAPQYK